MNNNATTFDSVECIQLPKVSVEELIRYGKQPVIKGGCLICDEEHFTGTRLTPSILEAKAGVFVSIYIKGEDSKLTLRGRIGTIEPSRTCIGEELLRNAIGAATQDPSFEPVTEAELPLLTYRVDIVGKLQQISDVSIVDWTKSGLVITKGYRRGIVLPCEEDVNSSQEELSLALSRGDIELSEKPDIYIFQTTSFTGR